MINNNKNLIKNDNLDDSDDFIQEYCKNKYNALLDNLIKEYSDEDDMFNHIEKDNTNIFVHFYSPKFQKCTALNCVLSQIVQEDKYPYIQFTKINANKCHVSTKTMEITMLPCVAIFKNGYFIEKLTGFEKFGNRETIKKSDVEKYLNQSELTKTW